MTDLLALSMIVKDEARGIERTLRSVLGQVGRYLILDTGSTDGTPRIIQEIMRGVPGEVRFAPFIDFSTTRNQALEMLGEKATFALLLSGDEHLVAPEQALLKQCMALKDASEGAYHLRVQFGADQYDSARVMRTHARWRYRGLTHEVLTDANGDGAKVRLQGVTVVHDLSRRDPLKCRKRWFQDVQLLERQLLNDPNDRRACFYLAQSLECLGSFARAESLYGQRAGMGGWSEEVYESLYRIARCQEAQRKPWTLAMSNYLAAFSVDPARAEPLYRIAQHYHLERNWALCYLFAKRAAELPLPQSRSLFVESEVYRLQAADLLSTAAWYVGEHEVGESALQKALLACPTDERLNGNLELYQRRRHAS